MAITLCTQHNITFRRYDVPVDSYIAGELSEKLRFAKMQLRLRRKAKPCH